MYSRTGLSWSWLGAQASYTRLPATKGNDDDGSDDYDDIERRASSSTVYSRTGDDEDCQNVNISGLNMK